MDRTAYNYTLEEQTAFRERNVAKLKLLRDQLRIREARTREITSVKNQLAHAENTRIAVLAADRRPLAWSFWTEFLAVGVLAAGEMFFNYLAALGLLQDNTITWGVTVGVTLILGCLVWGVAYELREHRKKGTEEAPAAEWPHSLTPALLTLSTAVVAYLIVSLFLRQRYFGQENYLSGAGAIVSNPWFIAGVLTVLAAVFVVAIVYIVSHANTALATANRTIRGIRHRLPKLEEIKQSAEKHVEQAKTDLDIESRISQENVLRRLAAENLTSTDESSRSTLARDVLVHFESWWRDNVAVARDPEPQQIPSAIGARERADGEAI